MIIDAEAILFDSDGVLVDSHVMVDQAWRQLADEFGLDLQIVLSELSGVRAQDTLSKHLPAVDVERAVKRLENLEVELAAGTAPIPGAATLISELPPNSWAIVTSASSRLAQARWAGAGISAPRVMVTAESVVRGKPDPEPYLVAAEQLGKGPDRCLVFEDSSAGGVAARSAGAMVAAVGAEPWPFKPAIRVPDLTCVRVETSGTAVRLSFT